MSENADRYRRLAETFTSRVSGVPAERWDDPAPCEGWTARDVVRHVVDTCSMFLGQIGRSVEGGPSVDNDPLGAWIHARDTIQTALDDPEVAGTEYDGFTGRTTFDATLGTFGCGDLLVHGWDLARATGQDEALDAGEMERTRTWLGGMGDAIRSPGVFGPEVEVPADADAQTRFLAFTGRKA